MVDIKEIDTGLFYFINHGLSNPFFDIIMPFITHIPEILVLPLLFIISIKDKRLALYSLVISIISLTVTDAVTNILKHIIQRPRPFTELQDVITLVGKGKSFSMPSAHASNIVAVTTVFLYFISKITERLRRVLFSAYLLLIALLVCISRIYVGVHYPSDVIIGALLGLTISFVILKIYNYTGLLISHKRYERIGLILLLLLSLFRLYYIQMGPLDLSPDEAHYWEWSRRLDLSYYSKGPAIAYLIKAGTLLFGNTEMGVRFLAVLFLFFASIILYRLGKEISEDIYPPNSQMPSLVGTLSASLLQVIPLFSAYAVVMTIDSPFIFFWTLSLYLFYRAQKDLPARKGNMGYWILLGLSTGIGVLTKYTMAFFYLSAVLYIVSHRSKRSLILSAPAWIAFVVSILVSSPVIIWNYSHNWVTFLHTAGQAHIYDGLTLRPERFFEFIGSQLGVVTPILCVMMFVSTLKLKKRGEPLGMLFWFSIPLVLFFLLKSLQGKVQANWALPAYISMLVALGFYITENWFIFSRYVRGTFIAGVVMALTLTFLAHYPQAINLPPQLDPTARLRGWEALGGEISRLAKTIKGPFFIFSDRYQISSELAFYVKGNPTTYCANLGRRMNQYDLWPGFYDLINYNAIFVTWGDKDFPKLLQDRFVHYEKRLFVVKERGKISRKYSIFLCYGFKGMEKTSPKEF